MLEAFNKSMQNTLLSNPHSNTIHPSESSTIAEETRAKVLSFLHADPMHFDVVFTANATAAIKLVVECFTGHENGFDYLYHLNSHTSIVGVREVARQSRCLASDEETEKWLLAERNGADTDHPERPTLFAYPAQSNMNGQRLPLNWPSLIRCNQAHQNTFTLLDAAAFVSTGVLDLSDSDTAPDFVAFSFCKVFGFPDLGALIVRKASGHVLKHRKYFGGGTVDMITVLEDHPQVVTREDSIHSRLEDGSMPIRSILALRCALDAYESLFLDTKHVSKHTCWLVAGLYKRLSSLKHQNGHPVCYFYTADGSSYGDPLSQGATIAMNLRRNDGTWFDANEVGSLLLKQKVQVRTGSLCNPAGMAKALGWPAEAIKKAYAAGHRCSQQKIQKVPTKPFGMVRITLGPLSTSVDVESICTWIGKLFVD